MEQNVQDIHFAFDRYDITPEQQAVLQADAQWLKTHPNSIITIEGHADERGGIVYNLALPDKRAIAVRDALNAKANPFYKTISTSFSGTSEYMAMEKLGQLRARDEWDDPLS